MKRLIMVFFAGLFLAAGMTGCNTMRGAGEDIESVGEEMQKAD